MGKLVRLRVFVAGLRGLGVEVCKNLILAGPKSVTIHDKNVVSVNDLCSNFYLTPDHVGKATRAQGSFDQL